MQNPSMVNNHRGARGDFAKGPTNQLWFPQPSTEGPRISGITDGRLGTWAPSSYIMLKEYYVMLKEAGSILTLDHKIGKQPHNCLVPNRKRPEHSFLVLRSWGHAKCCLRSESKKVVSGRRI